MAHMLSPELSLLERTQGRPLQEPSGRLPSAFGGDINTHTHTQQTCGYSFCVVRFGFAPDPLEGDY